MTVAWITEIQNNSSQPIEQWCNQPEGPEAHLGVFEGKLCGSPNKKYHPKKGILKLCPGDKVKAEWCAIPWRDGKHYRYLKPSNGNVIRLCTLNKVIEGKKYDCIQFIDDAKNEEIGIFPYGFTSVGASLSYKLRLVITNDSISFDYLGLDATGAKVLGALEGIAKVAASVAAKIAFSALLV